MAKQNIYDNETFFEGYQKLRERGVNANNLFEIPARFALLPDLKGLRVLDLGCGMGDDCMEYIRQGAKSVVGVDISEKMLEAAKEKNSDPNITYIRMPMEDIYKLEGEFDLVVSSLAIHYVEDYKGVLKNVNRLLVKGGVFVFSQEHPVNSSYGGGERWLKDENGIKTYSLLSNYGIEGERESTWFVDNVKKYHRTFSTVINDLIDAGFAVERLTEPAPTKEIIEKYPDYYDLYHRPDFLLVKAKKI